SFLTRPDSRSPQHSIIHSRSQSDLCTPATEYLDYIHEKICTDTHITVRLSRSSPRMKWLHSHSRQYLDCTHDGRPFDRSDSRTTVGRATITSASNRADSGVARSFVPTVTWSLQFQM